jgi:purine-binding chemotaxis protein CheW
MDEIARQFLTFEISGLEVGIGIREVEQIVEYVAPTPVPHLPPAIRGVINLRGRVVPVVDLALKLGLSPRPASKRACIIVVETLEAGVLGLAADSVKGLIDVGDEGPLPLPDFGLPVKTEYLRGLAKGSDKLILLIDSVRVLSPAELLATAEGLSARAEAG